MEDADGGKTENKFKKLIYLAAPGLSCGMQALGCDMWDPVPWPGIELRPQALGAWGLGYWTTREVPKNTLFSDFRDWTIWETGLQVLLNGKGVNKREGRKDNYEWKRGIDKKKIYPCDLEKSQIELRRKRMKLEWKTYFSQCWTFQPNCQRTRYSSVIKIALSATPCGVSIERLVFAQTLALISSGACVN